MPQVLMRSPFFGTSDPGTMPSLREVALRSLATIVRRDEQYHEKSCTNIDVLYAPLIDWLFPRKLPRRRRHCKLISSAPITRWPKATMAILLLFIWQPDKAAASTVAPSFNAIAILSTSLSSLPAKEMNGSSALPPKERIAPIDRESKVESAASEYATGIAISIATSLIASFIFWLALYLRRPKIIISPAIIRHRTGLDVDYYLIKLVNASRTDLVGLKYELHLISPRPNKWITLPSGKQKQVRLLNKSKLKLGIDGARTESMILKRYLEPSKDVNGDALYAQVFSVRKDKQFGRKTLDTLLSGSVNSYLVFTVYAIHPASGFGKTFTQVYSQADIIDGEEFEWGSSFKALPWQQMNSTNSKSSP